MPDNKPDDQTAALRKRAELAEKRSNAWRTMTDAHRAYHGKLGEDERDVFLFKSATERDAQVKAAKDADPEVYTSKRLNRVFRASDDQTLVEMAKQADKDAEELAKARAERDDAQFSKVATDTLGHLAFKKEAGKYDDGVALVKAVHTIEDKDQRARVLATLKACDAIAKAGYRVEGTDNAGDGDDDPVVTVKSADDNEARAELQKMAEELAAKENIHPMIAKRRLLSTNPKAKELMRKAQAHDARRN